ncbi:MotB family protein [Notoacmeibacter sp. MSK16QG-6]|uniref:MotB family protein n=1 Tax=Notoacmeibacter sp. MSK16QG-6 TaxID=2957982 RepID=UPI00209D3D9D|nr:MotB family protein [Notoacmeibacter sp. MSK16QG-6]MCP1200930.1 MotB family protein [Notoacmeibacter sp. MSK16QG-6]
MSGGNGEIIIVRRASEHDDSHHGGAWKIAFADFMTAMMALFLVLWLINAANEETKQSVASYFNPVKLVDDRRTVKGMSKSESTEPSEDGEASGKTESNSEKTQSEQYDHSQPAKNETTDTSYLANPTQLLESLAAEERALLTARGEMVADPGVEKTAEFADPFAPNFWQPLRVVASDGDPEARVFDQNIEDGEAGLPEANDDEAAEESEQVKDDEASISQRSPEETELEKEGQQSEAASSDGLGDEAETVETPAERLETVLREAVAQEADPSGKIAEALSVTPVPEGLRISLTDNLPDQMFQVGSAVPTGPVVLALEAVGRELQNRPGNILIQGHTDSRPMRKKGDDNWRLSTDRARSVYFMLLRGGLDDSRVTQIAGFADRKPMVPDDGLDPRNRRIEILLETP